LEYDSIVRRIFHNALSVWFLVAMTMMQGCAGPAQNAGAYGSRNAGSSADGNPIDGRSGPAAVGGKEQANNPVNGHGYVADQSASTALTDYLKQHRLPLVGAQVLRNPNNGSRAVVLYGFVGSDYGKSDAQHQAEDFINDDSVDVDNRIRVNPELLSARGSAAEGPPDSSDDPNQPAEASANASMPGVQSYVDQQNQSAQIQQYQQQTTMSSMNSMLPLIALLGILSMEMAASSGSSFSTGPPMGYPRYGYSSPYGNSPYASPYSSPYSGYAAPGMPSFSSGGPGYGSGGSSRYGYGSPGSGVTPFGSLPGSPYYSAP
jgi:hypothetical protein